MTGNTVTLLEGSAKYQKKYKEILWEVGDFGDTEVLVHRGSGYVVFWGECIRNWEDEGH